MIDLGLRAGFYTLSGVASAVSTPVGGAYAWMGYKGFSFEARGYYFPGLLWVDASLGWEFMRRFSVFTAYRMEQLSETLGSQSTSGIYGGIHFQLR